MIVTGCLPERRDGGLTGETTARKLVSRINPSVSRRVSRFLVGPFEIIEV